MSERRGFRIHFYGILAVVLACLILTWGTTFRGDPEMTLILLTGATFLIIGLSLGTITTGLKWKFWEMNPLEPIIWSALSFGTIYIVNRVVPIQFNIAGVDPQNLGILVGVAEECFFRVWLCGMFSIYSEWGSIVGTSAIWTGYHVARYGGNPSALLIVFLCGLFLGWIYVKSRLADGVIFAHAFVNYLALQ